MVSIYRCSSRRLFLDFTNYLDNPIPNIFMHPLKDTIFKWQFVIIGSQDSPYAGGIYTGELSFTKEYPFEPPSVIFQTPSGRFIPEINLCFSVSIHHPLGWDSSWNPGMFMEAVMYFMHEETQTYGSIESTIEEKKLLARQSMAFNLENETFIELFPDLVEAYFEEQVEMDGNHAGNQRRLYQNVPRVDDASFTVRNRASQTLKYIAVSFLILLFAGFLGYLYKA